MSFTRVTGVLRARDDSPQPGHGKSERQTGGVLEGAELAAWTTTTWIGRVQSQRESDPYLNRSHQRRIFEKKFLKEDGCTMTLHVFLYVGLEEIKIKSMKFHRVTRVLQLPFEITNQLDAHFFMPLYASFFSSYRREFALKKEKKNFIFRSPRARSTIPSFRPGRPATSFSTSAWSSTTTSSSTTRRT